MNLRGYDEWKTRSDDPGRVGRGKRGLAYRCVTCEWSGRGVAAYDHHTENPAHRIVLRDLPEAGPIIFGHSTY